MVDVLGLDVSNEIVAAGEPLVALGTPVHVLTSNVRVEAVHVVEFHVARFAAKFVRVSNARCFHLVHVLVELLISSAVGWRGNSLAGGLFCGSIDVHRHDGWSVVFNHVPLQVVLPAFRIIAAHAANGVRIASMLRQTMTNKRVTPGEFLPANLAFERIRHSKACGNN